MIDDELDIDPSLVGEQRLFLDVDPAMIATGQAQPPAPAFRAVSCQCGAGMNLGDGNLCIRCHLPPAHGHLEALLAEEDYPRMALSQILPADFPLPALVRFVPDVRLRDALVSAVTMALAIDVTVDGGMVRADDALAAVRAGLKAVSGHFEEPAKIAYDLHRNITSTRGEWLMPGHECVDLVGRRVATEQRRLEAVAAAKRREDQRLADEQARKEAQARLEAARARQAPPAVVQQMTLAAETAKAPPVQPTQAAPAPLRHTAITHPWKARIAGTPAEDEPNPTTAKLTSAQAVHVLKLMADVVAGKQPIAIFDINWSLINARAKKEEGTLNITGIEAYEDIGTRSKPGRRT